MVAEEKREEVVVGGEAAAEEEVVEKVEVRALGSVLLRPNEVNELARLFIIPPVPEDAVARWVGAAAAAAVAVGAAAAVETGGVYVAAGLSVTADAAAGGVVPKSGDEVLGEAVADESCDGESGGDEGDAKARINGSSSSTAARVVRFTLIKE